MDDSQGGDFSKTLMSLQLQVQTLLEAAGGDDLAPLLDDLSKLRKSEQKLLISTFRKALSTYLKGPRIAESAEELALRKFEEELFQDLTQALSAPVSAQRKSLEVLSGGKQPSTTRRRVVSLAEARARRDKQIFQ